MLKYTTTLTAALLLAGSAAFAQMGDMVAHFTDQWDMDSYGQVTLAGAQHLGTSLDAFRQAGGSK